MEPGVVFEEAEADQFGELWKVVRQPLLGVEMVVLVGPKIDRQGIARPAGAEARIFNNELNTKLVQFELRPLEKARL